MAHAELWGSAGVGPVVDRTPPIASRHPLRCWQRIRLPKPVRQDALLQLSAIASQQGSRIDADDVLGSGWLAGAGAAPSPAQWRALAAGVAVGDALALLALGRALQVEQWVGQGPEADPVLSALRLAIYGGSRDVRIVAAVEMLLALPQLLDRPLLSPISPTRSGRAVVAGEIAYRVLRDTSPGGGTATDVVVGVVAAWVRTMAEILRRDFPVPFVEVGTTVRDHAAFVAALQARGTGMSGGGNQFGKLVAASAAGRSTPSTLRRPAGYGLASAVFPDGEGAGPDMDDAGPDGDGEAGSTLVLFPAYSPAWTSESRTALSARYAVLGRPMPLAMAPGPVAAREALAALAEEMPNFGSAVERVADHLCLARRLSPHPVLRLPPLLLLGPPGIGKTRFARRLAEVLDVPFAWKGLAGSSDNRDLAGTARGWSSAQPSWPVTRLVQLGVANPVLLIDEIDKAGGGERNGRAHDTMLALLEPGTSRRYEDECLGGPIDLSAISWILTANDISGLPAPLRSRLAVVECGPPLPHHVPALIAGMLQDVAAEHGVADPRMLPLIPRELLQELEADYARQADPRRLRRGLVRALALAARLEEAEPGVAPVLH